GVARSAIGYAKKKGYLLTSKGKGATVLHRLAPEVLEGLRSHTAIPMDRVEAPELPESLPAQGATAPPLVHLGPADSATTPEPIQPAAVDSPIRRGPPSTLANQPAPGLVDTPPPPLRAARGSTGRSGP